MAVRIATTADINDENNNNQDAYALDLNIAHGTGINPFTGFVQSQSVAGSGVYIGNGFILSAAHNFVLSV